MERMNKSLIYLTGIFMLVLTLLANLQVLTRFILEMSLPWVEEVIRYIMVYLVLIMGSTAIYLNSHLNVDILDLVIKGKFLQILQKLRAVLILVFTASYAYLAYQLIIDTIEMGQVTPALQISMAWPLSALLLGGVIMSINCIYLLFPKKPRINSNTSGTKEG
ncbi:TRAP transporter small permease [Mesobacillus maritimus]|uniref:TRAP transporter small permease n=1 Tax=Mesobacillus maritimus TaxID=1643336 RepID=UPI00203EE196|nr:TRAP transporter small permease [Mesobacillus maritimus]MCM3584979.1 TRAP transporter small permease [Mesobacillus maritimus]